MVGFVFKGSEYVESVIENVEDKETRNYSNKNILSVKFPGHVLCLNYNYWSFVLLVNPERAGNSNFRLYPCFHASVRSSVPYVVRNYIVRLCPCVRQCVRSLYQRHVCFFVKRFQRGCSHVWLEASPTRICLRQTSSSESPFSNRCNPFRIQSPCSILVIVPQSGSRHRLQLPVNTQLCCSGRGTTCIELNWEGRGGSVDGTRVDNLREGDKRRHFIRGW
jgi:hypothetical protein